MNGQTDRTPPLRNISSAPPFRVIYKWDQWAQATIRFVCPMAG